MEQKHFNIEIKSDSISNGVISGYGSIYGNVDRYGDIVARGAFTEALKSERKVKMLYQHDSHEVIGVWTLIKEDDNGLYVEGKLADTERGREVKQLIEMGALEGLSIGYSVSDVEYNGESRVIKSAELFEISIVTFPANESATITAIKAADYSKRDLEKKLIESGFSRSVAKALIAGGYEALKNYRDDSSEVIDEETISLSETEEKKMINISIDALNNLRRLINGTGNK